jgi:hypothetical protein
MRRVLRVMLVKDAAQDLRAVSLQAPNLTSRAMTDPSFARARRPLLSSGLLPGRGEAALTDIKEVLITR